MNNIKRLCRIAFVAGLLLHGTVALGAEEPFDPFSVDIESNICHPSVAEKHSVKIAGAMASLRRALAERGYAASGVRKGEVVMVTIPCARLFAPNSTELTDSGQKQILGLLPYIKRCDNYKVIIAVHSDDTGDSEYADRITESRAASIDKFISAQEGTVECVIVPYGLGADEPLASNSGVRNRAANRRAEIYFVPTQHFIDKARRK
ncbi:MAG: OmpA family protein [Muribaculaceae bacterium]|nr:OmpA family protein [Muribaculaceae bacterium]